MSFEPDTQTIDVANLNSESDSDLEKGEDNQEISDADLVNRIYKNLSASRRHLAVSRDEMHRDFDYHAGNQWAEEDRKILNEQGRPAVVFNRIPRIVNAVCGLEVQNRQEVQFLARRTDPQSGSQSDIINAAVKWVRDGCDAEDEDSEAFRDCIISGYGITETVMDYEMNPDGDIKINRIDPLEILYDPGSKKKNLADAKWIAHVIQMSKEEVAQMWPDDVEEAGEGSFDMGNADGEIVVDNPGNQYSGTYADKNVGEKKITVIKYQEYIIENFYRMINPLSGQIESVTSDDYDALQQNPLTMHLKGVKTPTRVYTEYYLIGKKIVEANLLKCNAFTFNIITGLYDRNNNVYFGLVRLMRDPQMWQNKWLSQIMHIINTNAKGGLMIEEGAFVNQRTALDEWAKPDSVTIFRTGALAGGKVQQKNAPAYPQGIDHLMNYAQTAVNDVSGVSLEFLGQANRDQPYVLEYQRQKQGTLILAPFFDSLRRYRKMQGRVLYKYIRDYISDGRLIRAIGQTQEQYIPLLRDELALDYDVVVSDAPTSPNVKERVFEILNQIIPIALQAGIPIPPDVLDYAPLPENLVMSWKQMINQKAQDPVAQQLSQLHLVNAQLQTANMDLDNQLKAAQVQDTMSNVPLNNAKAQAAIGKGEDQTALAQQRMHITNNEHEAEMRQMLVDQAMNHIDQMMEARRKNNESNMNMAIKARESQFNMALKAKEAQQKTQIAQKQAKN